MGLFRKRWQVARIAGFPIEVNLSFLLLLGLVFLSFGLRRGLLFVAIIPPSVLVHELGHALVARRRGVVIGGIELQFFGGMAKMVTPPRSARDEIAIALAGPAVSFVIAATALAAGVVVAPLSRVVAGVLLSITTTNLMLGIFNLLPALPMDGGRVLRAWLARRRGVMAATRTAVTTTKWLAIGLGALAVLSHEYFLGVLALMIYLMSRAELQGAWALHYSDAPAEPITVDVLDAGGRVIDAAAPPVGAPWDWPQPGAWPGQAPGATVRRVWVYRR